MAAEVLEFLGLPPSAAVDEYVSTHTKAEAGGGKRFSRDSTSHAFSWLAPDSGLATVELERVQRLCRPAMEDLGYRPLRSEADRSPAGAFAALTKSRGEVWPS